MDLVGGARRTSSFGHASNRNRRRNLTRNCWISARRMDFAVKIGEDRGQGSWWAREEKSLDLALLLKSHESRYVGVTCLVTSICWRVDKLS